MTQLTTKNQEIPEHLKAALSGPGRGNENVTTADVSVPRLILIQDKTSCLKKGHEAYIEGSKPGMMYNSLTRELYTELLVCFVTFEMEYIPKQARKTQSEFIGRFKTKAEAQKAIDGVENSSTFFVQDTPQHYGLLIGTTPEGIDPIVIAMNGAKKTAHKQVNNITRQGDRFAYTLKLTSMLVTINGNEMYTYKVDFEEFTPVDVFKNAEELYNIHKAGKTSINVEDVENLGEDTPEVSPH